jgi:hypothetical protein
MKITAFLVTFSFLICFPAFVFAKDELVMFKEVMYWVSNGKGSGLACNQLIFIKVGQDVPDMRKEKCGYTEGKFSVTLSGPPGTTVTFFGKYGFKKGNGFLTIKKKDDQKLWLLDLTAFPPGQWFTSEANDNSGSFEAFYNASPIFEQSVSSIKWGNDSPEG